MTITRSQNRDNGRNDVILVQRERDVRDCGALNFIGIGRNTMGEWEKDKRVRQTDDIIISKSLLS